MISYDLDEVYMLSHIFLLIILNSSITHTHTHNRFTAGLEYVRVHPGQQVPER